MSEPRQTYDPSARLQALESAVAYLLTLIGGQIAEQGGTTVVESTEILCQGLLNVVGPVEEEMRLALNDLIVGAAALAEELDRAVLVDDR
jgi:hypothetical protein